MAWGKFIVPALTKMAGGSVLGLLFASSGISFAGGVGITYYKMHKAKVQAATNAEVLRLTGELAGEKAGRAAEKQNLKEAKTRITDLEAEVKPQAVKIVTRTNTVTKEVQADESPVFEMRLPAHHIARRNCLRVNGPAAACSQDSERKSLPIAAAGDGESGELAGDPDGGRWDSGYPQ